MNKIQREKGEKYQSIMAKVIILLQQRNDLTRRKLCETLGYTWGNNNPVDVALTKLRKAGYKIYPSGGYNSPLRVVTSESMANKYIAWRHKKYLPTARRMIMAELELGDEYKGLEGKYKDTLKFLNNTDEI